MTKENERRWLGALLAAAVISYLIALNWGLPTPILTWAADELSPWLMRDAMNSSFGQGWHTQYPPLHMFFLLTVYGPFLLLGTDTELTLGLAGRILSVAMGAATLVCVYRLGKKFLAPSWALVGTALFAFAPTTVYYSKLANLEIPYTFWLIASFGVLWEVFEHHRKRDYLLFSLLAITAICTKEQVYGFYVLLVPLVFYSRWRSEKVSRAFLDATLVYCILLVIVCTVLFQNVLFNFDGFVSHIMLITGSKYQSFAMFRPDLEGHWRMIKLTFEQHAVVESIPVFILTLIGVGIALVQRMKGRWLLLSIVSYQIFFIHKVLYAYDRFFVPNAAILSLFAALALSEIAKRAPTPATVLAGLLIAYQFGRGAELNAMMVNDTRYVAERWMEENIPADRFIGEFGQARYLPRHPQYANRRTVGPNIYAFQKLDPKPDCILATFNEEPYFSRGHPGKVMIRGLESGRVGTTTVFLAKRRENYLFDPDFFLGREQSEYSNLAKVSPLTRIFSHEGRCTK